MYEVKYVSFKNKDWNYLKLIQKDKIIIYVNSR